MGIERTLRRRAVAVVLALIVGVGLGVPAATTAGAFPGAHTAPRYSAARTRQILASQINAYLRREVSAGQFSGMVLVARRGVVLFERGYGTADDMTGLRNTPETVFRIGSVTKQFTAMAILLLRDRGKLRVRDRICVYLARCPGRWGAITIHQLLTHTSGIPDYHQFPESRHAEQALGTPDRFIADLGTKPLLFAPGTHYSYSNSGYIVLGSIIERISGEPYATFMEQNILGPLHLRHMGFYRPGLAIVRLAKGYSRPLHRITGLDLPFPTPSADLYATAGDLYRWDRALDAGQLASQQALAWMFSSYVLTPEHLRSLVIPAYYGYGWFITTELGHPLAYHTGGVPGFRAFNGRYPRDSAEVIVLSNLERTPISALGATLGAMLLAN